MNHKSHPVLRSLYPRKLITWGGLIRISGSTDDEVLRRRKWKCRRQKMRGRRRSLKLLKFSRQRTNGNREGRNGRRAIKKERGRKKRHEEELLRFSERGGQGEDEELVRGRKRRANLLTAITGVREYNVVNSTFSRADFRPTFPSPFSSSLLSSYFPPVFLFSLDYFGPNKVGAIQLTRRAISAPSP